MHHRYPSETNAINFLRHYLYRWTMLALCGGFLVFSLLHDCERASAFEVLVAGDAFSGSLVGNPVISEDPEEVTITLNSSPEVEPPNMITCTTGSVEGTVPELPINPDPNGDSVYLDSGTNLSISGCTFTGEQPMSESGDGTWQLTWDKVSEYKIIAIVRLPAGFNFIGQVGEHPCTVTIGPDDSETMIGSWENQTSTSPAKLVFTNQELIVTASNPGCGTGTVHTADFSGTFSVADSVLGHQLIARN